MDRPPLSLSVLRLSPQSLFVADPDDPPPPSPIDLEPKVSEDPIPALSPTHNYAGPYPSASLGSNLAVVLELKNISTSGVQGVKMMCEVQSPGGRYRLGEVVHGQEEQEGSPSEEKTPVEEASTADAEKDEGSSKDDPPAEAGPSKAVAPTSTVEPELPTGDSVKLDVGSEMKELGLHVLICSVAWETLDGRRTFQRFLKFNVSPPLAIKTRIYSSPHPNTALDPIAREYIYLEILMQNISFQGMIFDRIVLETVHGLVTQSLSAEEESKISAMEEALMPGDTRQQLFKLAPTPKPPSEADTDACSKLAQSTFLPIHPPGSILPLGRLDLSWRAGRTHDPGRLQTSTLNRRIPQAQPAAPGQTPSNSTIPTRTTTAATASPANASVARMGSPKPPLPPKGELDHSYEFDLVVIGEREVSVEEEFEMEIRLAMRTAPVDDELDQPQPPEPVHIAFQYLSRPPPQPHQPTPIPTPRLDISSGMSTPLSVRSPTVPPPPNMSRTTTLTSAPRASMGSRPFSPLSSPPMSTSQPMSPVQSQLRQASTQTLYSPKLDASMLTARAPSPVPAATFPPLPYTTASSSLRPGAPAETNSRTLYLDGLLNTGRIHHLGGSLQLVPAKEWTLIEERMGTTYTEPIAPSRRWEASYSFKTRFISLDEGLAELGGARVLVLDNASGLSGIVGREWESLGHVWVVE